MDNTNLKEKLVTQAKKSAELIKDGISVQFYDKLCSTIIMSENHVQGADKLIAVMDFIMAYPDEKTAFTGFLMTDISVQNCGTRSKIIDDLCVYLKTIEL